MLVNVGETVRFMINLTYYDSDGDGPRYILKNIVISDILPEGLEYANNASISETVIIDNNIIWDLVVLELYTGDNLQIEFDVDVLEPGLFYNTANLTSKESCENITHYGEAYASLFGLTDNNHRKRDVDDDGNLEYAFDLNLNMSDGFEQFYDPDNSSFTQWPVDGDSDSGFIDHLIDIDRETNGEYPDILLPDRYWDPDDDILTDVFVEDVDYDETFEYVFDSDGDDELDHYYDPDDQQIYPYVVYTLNVETIGNGNVGITPMGELYLEDFLVTLDAQPDENWNFDKWTGDRTGSENPIIITMNKDMSITAHFSESGGDDDDVLPTVEITKPLDNSKYRFNIRVQEIVGMTQIIGSITIKADASSIIRDIDRVEFYINDVKIRTDRSEPYSYTWLFKKLEVNNIYTIKVVAYDTEGNSNFDEITVKRFRLTPFRTPILSAIVVFLILNQLRGGNETETEPEEKIKINRAPNADAGGPYSGVVGVAVKFDASGSSDPDDDELEYKWDFNDDTMRSGETTSHIYDEEGEYTVRLTVTDIHGEIDIDIVTVKIYESEHEKDIAEGEAKEEDEMFWYIVSGLCGILFIALAALIIRRKLYV
jgi:uncharacterized repeat protein (TIGR02543 family)